MSRQSISFTRRRSGRNCDARVPWSSWSLSKSLGDKSFLDGHRFTAGDLMMTTVLRILKHPDIVSSDRLLAAYIERCTSRPAFKRALDAQIGDFKKAA